MISRLPITTIVFLVLFKKVNQKIYTIQKWKQYL